MEESEPLHLEGCLHYHLVSGQNIVVNTSDADVGIPCVDTSFVPSTHDDALRSKERFMINSGNLTKEWMEFWNLLDDMPRWDLQVLPQSLLLDLLAHFLFRARG